MFYPTSRLHVLDSGGKRSATPLSNDPTRKSGVAAALCHRSPKCALARFTVNSYRVRANIIRQSHSERNKTEPAAP